MQTTYTRHCIPRDKRASVRVISRQVLIEDGTRVDLGVLIRRTMSLGYSIEPQSRNRLMVRSVHRR
jgi:hypothetical protein